MRSVCTLGLFAIVACVPSVASAAHLYLDPETTTHNQLDTFYVPIRIDTHGECINAVDVAIAYDPAALDMKDVMTGDSILTLWTAPPAIDRERGRVTFAGGIPGGYCGRIEGDPGRTNTLAKLVVAAVPRAGALGTTANNSLIVEPSTTVYLHDGAGNVADLTVVGTDLTFVVATGTPDNEWLGDVKEDATAPEYFEITLVQGPSEGNTRHYITFNTTDKQSGIDHYEVLETDPDQFGFLSWIPKKAYWVPAESPSYVLRDQHLHSKIMVRAVDKNGNERVAEYVPLMSPLVSFTRASFLIPLALFVSFITMVIAVLVRFARMRRRVEGRTTPPQDPMEPYEDE